MAQATDEHNVDLDAGLEAMLQRTGAFDGQARWLSIGVRPGDETGAYTLLALRQPLTAAPYAGYAPEAGSVPWEAVSQNPIPGSCAAGQIMAWNETLTAWECAENSTTTYSAGFGLALDNTTFNVLSVMTVDEAANLGLSVSDGTMDASGNSTIMDILLATDLKAKEGLLYDVDGDHTIDASELLLRMLANELYTSINEESEI